MSVLTRHSYRKNQSAHTMRIRIPDLINVSSTYIYLIQNYYYKGKVRLHTVCTEDVSANPRLTQIQQK